MPTDPPKKFAREVGESDDDASDEWLDEETVARYAAELADDALTQGNRRLPPDLTKLKREIQRAQRRGVVFDFDGYQVSSCVNGGMGMVLRAWDPALEREVAIKLWLEPGPKGNTDLLKEARTLARRNHPNIVTVYGTGVWNEKRRYFTMEWVDGSDAQKWLKQPRTWREIRDLFVEAGKGLAAAHAEGIQHRDFKPSNILVGNDGRVCVADFGLADTMRSPDPLDESSGLAGTYSYVAPERLKLAKGDGRSDQYSFCVALWEALHENVPFCAPSVRELVRVIEAGVTTPVKRDSKVPHWLSRVVRKGLSYDPDQRHADMKALLKALIDEPPPDDRAEAGDGDGCEDFETRGYMHQPATHPVHAEHVDVVRVGLGPRAGRPGLLVGVSLLVGVFATLLAVGVFDVSTPTETGTLRAVPFSPRERAQLKFNEARELVERGKMQDAYDAWDEGRDLLLDEDPDLVGDVAMELAEAIAEHFPESADVAWFAAGASEAFEMAEDWTRAAKAARTVAGVYRGMKRETEAREYEDCAKDNDKQRACVSLVPVGTAD